jgi:adenylosuccinate lyase
MLVEFNELVRNWVVNIDRMRQNVESTGGAIFSQRVMLALVEHGMDRQDAYKLVQRHALDVWDNGGHLRDRLKSESNVVQALGEQGIDELFDYAYHLRNVDVAFERLGLLSPVEAGS